MFLPDTADDFAFAYIEARRARVPIDEMGTVERAGHFLLTSATRSDDGEMCPRDALGRALWSGEIEVAVAIHEGLMASRGDVEVPEGGNLCPPISGVLDAR